MKVRGKHYHTLWEKDPETIQVIDQRKLPFAFEIADLSHPEQVCVAIKEMWVRGAGLIGVCAGYGMYLAALEARKHKNPAERMQYWAQRLKKTRPTAVNLATAVDKQISQLQASSGTVEPALFLEMARAIKQQDMDFCKAIGTHGLQMIADISQSKNGEAVNILTHCNAGWLAFADYGSALAPVYAAFDQGLEIHVWVDETRPRNQGAKLTAWELQEHGVPHTLIADNTGGHLMQHGKVDVVIVGADRVAANGDAANKIGTYLKALAAHDNHVPFYVAFPSTTLDWSLRDGLKQIPIEERGGEEVTQMDGLGENGLMDIRITHPKTRAVNFGFDVTPARLITGLINERGICEADEKSLRELFKD